MTPPSTSSLHASLSARIDHEGPITLADFMQAALYDPLHGYYARGTPRVGTTGDFITSVSVGPLFGALVAHQLHEMWLGCSHPKRWTIVEQGANDGRLMLDIVTALRDRYPGFHARLEIIFIEPIPPLRALQQETLKDVPAVRWCEHLSQLEPFNGVHLSNELVDAFPIRRFRWQGDWTEDRITTTEEGFRFVTHPLDDTARELLRDFPTPPIHRIVEIAPTLGPWTALLLERLQYGFVLAFDYGLVDDEWNGCHRPNGTLRGYRNHRHADDPLSTPGQQDMTAHIDLSRWSRLLRHHGADHVLITDQHRFCSGLAPAHFPDRIRPMTPSEQRELLQFRSLSHPNFFGGAFRVLAAAKSAPSPSTLSGFRASL